MSDSVVTRCPFCKKDSLIIEIPSGEAVTCSYCDMWEQLEKMGATDNDN